jgi:hypothetical protein
VLHPTRHTTSPTLLWPSNTFLYSYLCRCNSALIFEFFTIGKETPTGSEPQINAIAFRGSAICFQGMGR